MKRSAKTIYWILFLIYIFILSVILFFGRKSYSQIPIEEYFFEYGNFMPFRTLIRYIRYVYIWKNAESFFLALVNIGGNLILFFPMGNFLPFLFKDLRDWKRFLCLISFLIFSSEFLQGFFRIGVPDVDDFLINILGAWMGFSMTKRLKFCRKIPS